MKEIASNLELPSNTISRWFLKQLDIQNNQVLKPYYAPKEQEEHQENSSIIQEKKILRKVVEQIGSKRYLAKVIEIEDTPPRHLKDVEHIIMLCPICDAMMKGKSVDMHFWIALHENIDKNLLHFSTWQYASVEEFNSSFRKCNMVTETSNEGLGELNDQRVKKLLHEIGNCTEKFKDEENEKIIAWRSIIPDSESPFSKWKLDGCNEESDRSVI